jgi:hypothetical protein
MTIQKTSANERNAIIYKGNQRMKADYIPELGSPDITIIHKNVGNIRPFTVYILQ